MPQSVFHTGGKSELSEQIQTRRKAYSLHQSPERSEGNQTHSAVKSRGTRDERAGASPHGGPHKFQQS